METINPEKLANYWQLEPKEATEVKTAYELECMNQDMGDGDWIDCDCGNCYDCRYTQAFSLPEYEIPLM